MRQGLVRKVSNKEAYQLNPSGTISIAATKLGSTGSFLRQFAGSRPTLEDLFSLMHQNILAAVAVLNPATQIPIEQLPELLQPLLQAFQSIPNINLLSISHQYPLLCLEYNLPLANHAATFILEYNQQTQQLDMNGCIFGLDNLGRMQPLADMIDIEGLLLDLEVKKKPYYSERAHVIEFSWAFETTQLSMLSLKISQAIKNYAAMTSTRRDLTFEYTNKTVYENNISSILTRHDNVDAVDACLSKGRLDIALKLVQANLYRFPDTFEKQEKLKQAIETYGDENIQVLLLPKLNEIIESAQKHVKQLTNPTDHMKAQVKIFKEAQASMTSDQNNDSTPSSGPQK